VGKNCQEVVELLYELMHDILPLVPEQMWLQELEGELFHMVQY
jgi:hypothetical protein